MRLQWVVASDTLQRGLADPRRLGHRSHRPLRGIGRSLPCGLGNHVGFPRGLDGGRATAAPCLPFDPRQPIPRKPVPPGSDRAPRTAQTGRNLLVSLAIRRSEYNLRPQHQTHRRAPPARPLRQRRSFFARYGDELPNP